jgi:hypothetical protein
MTARLILVPTGELYRVALAVYYDKGRFRIAMWHEQAQPYHDAMATLSRMKRKAKTALALPV